MWRQNQPYCKSKNINNCDKVFANNKKKKNNSNIVDYEILYECEYL